MLTLSHNLNSSFMKRIVRSTCYRRKYLSNLKIMMKMKTKMKMQTKKTITIIMAMAMAMAMAILTVAIM